jgi:hypothetical protein
VILMGRFAQLFVHGRSKSDWRCRRERRLLRLADEDALKLSDRRTL